MKNFIKIRIVGGNPNYFLHKIIDHSISIFALEKSKNELILTITGDDYNTIKKMKTTYKIQVLERYGIYKIQFLIRKYWYIILFLLLGVLLMIISSHLILDIDIHHPNQELVQMIRKDLEEFGIKKYRFKISYQKRERIKEKLLQKEKELVEWIEIEEVGTQYRIYVEERKKNQEKEVCIPRNIVAKKNAVLLEIQASSGEIVRKKNDYVVKGETIISGFIYNKDTIVSKRCSIGTIYGEVWYRVKVLLPKSDVIKKRLNDTYWGFTGSIFSYEISFPKKNRSFDKTEYNIIEGKILPIRIGISHFQEIEYTKIQYSSHTLEKKALDLVDKKIRDGLQEGEEVLMKKVLKKTEKDSKIEIEVFVKVKENITDYFDITNIEMIEEEG